MYIWHVAKGHAGCGTEGHSHPNEDAFRILNMNLDHLHPHAGSHAIQSMIFAVEWLPEPLQTTAGINFSEITPIVRSKLGNEFPIFEDIMAFTMSITAGQGNVSSQGGAGHRVSGFLLKKPSSTAGVPSRLINLSPDNLLIQINDYTRWKDARADVLRYLCTLMDLFGSNRPVIAIGLQVTDLFNWKSNPDELDLTQIFRRDDSMLLPSHVFDLKSLWHSHNGFLTQREQPQGCQQLDNVNVSRNDVNGLPTLQIVGSHRIQFPVPRFIRSAEHVEEIMALHDDLHRTNKGILAKLLTDQVLSKLDHFSTTDEKG